MADKSGLYRTCPPPGKIVLLEFACRVGIAGLPSREKPACKAWHAEQLYCETQKTESCRALPPKVFRTMEGQLEIGTTATPSYPVSVDEMNVAEDSTATQQCNGELSCCSWTVGDKNSSDPVNDYIAASVSCPSNVQEINAQPDMIVYVFKDVQSNGQESIPVIANESGIIDCNEPGLIESEDTAMCVSDTQHNRSTVMKVDYVHLDVPGSTTNGSSTYDLAECSSLVSLVKEESLSNVHSDTNAVQWMSSHSPQVDLTHNSNSTKNPMRNVLQESQMDEESQKKGKLDHHLSGTEEVEGASLSTTCDVLATETTINRQISEDGDKKEQSPQAAVNETLGHKGQVPTLSWKIISMDGSEQGQNCKGGQNDPPERENKTVSQAENTKLPGNQGVFDKEPPSTLPEEEEKVLSGNAEVVKHHIAAYALGHIPQGPHEGDRKSESRSESDCIVCEDKNSVSALTVKDQGQKNEMLQVEEDLEEGSSKMQMEHLDLPTPNLTERTSARPREQSMPEITDNNREDSLVTNVTKVEEKITDKGVGFAKDDSLKWIQIVNVGQDEKRAENRTPENKTPLDKSPMRPTEADQEFYCDQCTEDFQLQHLLDYHMRSCQKWRHSFTCNICSFTAFSVQDIEDHCVTCEEVRSVRNNKEVAGRNKMECEEEENESTPMDTSPVPPLVDSPQCEDASKCTVEEKGSAEALPDKIGSKTWNSPSLPDAQSTQVMLSHVNSTVLKDESSSTLQYGVPSRTCTEVRHGGSGENASPLENISQDKEITLASWKPILVHGGGQQRVRKFWQCPDCPYRTDKLFIKGREHAFRHMGLEKFKCELCTYSCPTQIGMCMHMKNHRRFCRNKKGQRKEQLEVQVSARQLRRRAGRSRKVYKCRRCNFATVVLASFEQHGKKHTRRCQVSRGNRQREDAARVRNGASSGNHLKKQVKDGCDYKSRKAKRSDFTKLENEAPSTTLTANKKMEWQDFERGQDKHMQRELEVLSDTSCSSYTNHSSRASTEGETSMLNTLSPQRSPKTKKYTCIKCSFSCNSWLSVKAHMAIHKKGKTHTPIDGETSKEKQQLENKVEESDASDDIACVIVDSHDSGHSNSGPEKSTKVFECPKSPLKIYRFGHVQKDEKCHYMAKRNYSFDFCSPSTSNIGALLGHQGHNSAVKERTAETPKVGTTSDRWSMADASTNTVVDKQQSLYHCKECPYMTDKPSILERHEKCHVIWRWYKRLREMSNTVELTTSEAKVASGNTDTGNCAIPDVPSLEMETEDGESKMEEFCKTYACGRGPCKTDLLPELEKHKTSDEDESKHIQNDGTTSSYSKTRELHQGDHEKVPTDIAKSDKKLGSEDQEAEYDENKSVVSIPAEPIDDSIDEAEEDEDKGTQSGLVARPKVDEYKYIFHCKECPFKTDWLHDLEKHKSGHDSVAEFPCDQCTFSAATKGAIEVHHRLHRYENANREAGTSPFPSSDVQTPGTSGTESSTFRRKMEEYLYIFNCGQCPFKTDWYHELAKHRLGHNANLEYPCDQCTFSSSMKRALEVHKRVHKDGSSAKTERLAGRLETNESTGHGSMERKCTQKVKTLTDRFPHMTPSGMRYYNHKCPKCPFRTDSRRKVEVHLIHHRTRGKYICDQCTYSSNHVMAMGSHRRVHVHSGYLHPARKEVPNNNVNSEGRRESPPKCHKCTKCPYKTDSRKKIDIHKVFHRRRGRYQCNMCSYSTNRMTTLGPHRRVHLQSQEVSDNTALDQAMEDVHVQPPQEAFTSGPRSHHGQMYSCSSCPSKFNSLPAIKAHAIHHSKKFRHSCPDCTYSADSTTSIRSHRGVHERQKDQDCRQPTQHATPTPTSPEALLTEEDKLQDKCVNKKGKYQCEYCPYTTDKPYRLSSHASKHGANYPNKCHLCSYSTEGPIKLHLRIHEMYDKGKTKGQKVDTAGSILTVEKIRGAKDSYRYKCSQCPYLAKAASYVRSHQRYHSADLPLKCPDCTFSCSRLQQLSCHVAWHGKDLSQLPGQEGQKTKKPRQGRIGALQQKLYEQGVERIPIDGVKHYICPHCPFRSRWADQAVAHLEHHVVMYTYKCAYCSYSTRTKDKVKIHMNLHKKKAGDSSVRSTDGGRKVATMGQGEEEAAGSSGQTNLLKGPRTRARIGVIGHSPVKYVASQDPACPPSSSVSRNLGDFSRTSECESTYIRYMTPSRNKEEPEEGQQVTVLTFVCMYCERPFTDQESWVAHMKRHRL